MDKMKLGILGLGSRSTTFYINELHKLYNQEKGGYSTCPFTLLNYNFDPINSLLPDASDSLDAIVQEYITELEKMDIESILIPNITLHETIDRLVTKKRIIHPIHLAVAKIKEKNWSKIVLFGSIYSIQSHYISSNFKANAIEVVLPSEEDSLLIDEVRKRVYSETETIGFIEDYHLLIEKYTKDSPVVLACTELSVFKPKKNNNNLLDMAQLQIIAAVQTVL
jgi:aspartate racemase